MELFRVDHREFSIKEQITTDSSYQGATNFEHKIVELCLEKKRPSNLLSRNNLFLFCNLKDALQFTININNVNIYLVNDMQPEISFKGDMNYIDKIFKAVMEEQSLHDIYILCSNYWNQTKTTTPCYETLAEKAIVQRKICTCVDIQKFNTEFKISQQIEKCPLYIEKFNQL